MFFSLAGVHGAPKARPLYGWCAGRHSKKNPKRAQSGYVGDDGKRYRKQCFRKTFPELHEAKQQKRRGVCGFCKLSTVNVMGGGSAKGALRRVVVEGVGR